MKHTRESLKETIRVLKIRQTNEREELLQHIKYSVEALQPVNLVKRSFSGLFRKKESVGLLESALPFLASIISGRLLFRGRNNRHLNRFVNTAVLLSIRKLTDRYSHQILHFSGDLLEKLSSFMEHAREPRKKRPVSDVSQDEYTEPTS